MKIGFDAKRYFNNKTGLGNYSKWLIDGLQNLNKDEYHLYHTSPRTHTLPVHSPKGILRFFSSLWRSRNVVRELVDDGIDVYHGLSNEIPFGIHRTTIKTVVTIHDLINLRYPEYYNSIDKLIYKAKLNYAIKYAHTIVVPSYQTKDDLINILNTSVDKIKVIPLSVKSSRSYTKDEYAYPPKTNYILCVSGFTKRKNLLNLVSAYKNIETDTHLVIAGRKGDTYAKVLNASNATNNIILMTDVSDDTLGLLYAKCDFCIYPSEYEGFGIPILEAFTHGKTVATSNVSSMPEVGGNAALYFNPLKREEIITCLNVLLDPVKRATYEENISERLHHFDSEKLLDQYQKLYQTI
jgi:glycosyltransferase involved in cell wall biosynthesis